MHSPPCRVISVGNISLLLVALSYVAAGAFVEFGDNTELIQQRAGYDVKLQCVGLKGMVEKSQMPADTQIHWYFKNCGEKCHELYENNEWTLLPCKEKSFCNAELLLRNVTENYSGLYKCTFRSDNGHAVDIQFVRKFHLDVKNETNVGAPEILDEYPINQTTAINSQIVFQCRVYSELYPTIKWFRRLSLPSEVLKHEQIIGYGSDKLVRYEGNVYELLQATGEKPFGNNIYLSKLILNNIRLEDEGFYACVAISMRGFTIREAYLSVYTKEEREAVDYWSEYDDNVDDETSTNPKEFLLLFLMPLGLAILPLTVWLIWLLHRRRQFLRNIRNANISIYLDEETTADRVILKA